MIETRIICPQCGKGQLMIGEEGAPGKIAFSFDGIVHQEILEDSPNFLFVECSRHKCDANFEINYENELVYWGLDGKDYTCRNGEWQKEAGDWQEEPIYEFTCRWADALGCMEKAQREKLEALRPEKRKELIDSFSRSIQNGLNAGLTSEWDFVLTQALSDSGFVEALDKE